MTSIVLLFIAVILCYSNIIDADDILANIVFTILLALIAAYIFYIFQIIIPNYKQIKKINPYLLSRFKELYMKITVIVLEPFSFTKDPTPYKTYAITKKQLKNAWDFVAEHYLKKDNEYKFCFDYVATPQSVHNLKNNDDGICYFLATHAIDLERFSKEILLIYSNYLNENQIKILEDINRSLYIDMFSPLGKEPNVHYISNDISVEMYDLYCISKELDKEIKKLETHK